MKKHAIYSKRAAAEPVSGRRMSDRSRPEDSVRPARRRPRRHDDPFLEPDADGVKGPRHGPARHDRRSSRHQLRGWGGGSWDAEPEDDGSEA